MHVVYTNTTVTLYYQCMTFCKINSYLKFVNLHDIVACIGTVTSLYNIIMIIYPGFRKAKKKKKLRISGICIKLTNNDVMM